MDLIFSSLGQTRGSTISKEHKLNRRLRQEDKALHRRSVNLAAEEQLVAVLRNRPRSPVPAST
jgi:hypothetical protein